MFSFGLWTLVHAFDKRKSILNVSFAVVFLALAAMAGERLQLRELRLDVGVNLKLFLAEKAVCPSWAISCLCSFSRIYHV